MAGLIPFNRKNRNVVGAKNPFNMIDDFFDEAFSDFPFIRRNFVMDHFKVDVRETDNEYLIEAELPGIKKEDIDISFNDDGRLSIAVNRNESIEEKDEDNTYIHKERRYGSMQRSLYLENAKPDEISAKMQDGLLKIIVAKEQTDNKNTRKVEIE
ncbi:heat-shock protein [Lederbergia ruris]|uniref:Heat-shock protein n=1 Tax=Lederbergia ruris TaxID=217495 RepID=A0ABQ4KNA6_9BACI|nr:Hsp20/alpha crystallin family protein [Lederbergia ruris]GIN58979.1 heat-shock protein [Lederbergia ruris]